MQAAVVHAFDRPLLAWCSISAERCSTIDLGTFVLHAHDHYLCGLDRHGRTI